MMGRATKYAWLGGYLISMASIACALLYARESIVARLSSPQERERWQSWREAADKHDQTGPVQRRPITSDEPPSLVLLRDHFGGIVATSLLIGSFLYGFLLLIVRGSLSGGQTRLEETRGR